MYRTSLGDVLRDNFSVFGEILSKNTLEITNNEIIDSAEYLIEKIKKDFKTFNSESIKKFLLNFQLENMMKT